MADTRNEIVLAFVAPIGANTTNLEGCLRHFFEEVEYQCEFRGVSRHIADYEADQGRELPREPEYERIAAFIRAGNAMREQLGNDVLARMTLGTIQKSRPSEKGFLTSKAHTAQVIISFKNPDEVRLLRRVYASSLFVVGIYSSRDDRKAFLQEQGMTEAQATALIEQDEKETAGHGQNTRDTFQLADVFIAAGSQGVNEEQLRRFLRLAFGDPYISPHIDESAMFHAYAASLCSASLARQVGAAIATERGDILATGRNDVPRFGGGSYWPGKEDLRDHAKGYDANDREKNELIISVYKALLPEAHAEMAAEADGIRRLVKEARKQLENTGLLDLTEFGRDVHAEMDAMLSASRNGTQLVGTTLYTTTFPCHNCAKHIVSAGLKRVVYIEPYPKSRAARLFVDTISVDRSVSNKVLFGPFVGVGPRKYFDLFSMRLGGGYPVERKDDRGLIVRWEPKKAAPRTSFSPSSYIDREAFEFQRLEETLAKLPRA